MGTGIAGASLIAVLLVAIAPLVLSALAKDWLSVLISLVLLVAAGIIVSVGNSALQEILATILYLAALVSASLIYVGRRIERMIESEGGATRSAIRRPDSL